MPTRTVDCFVLAIFSIVIITAAGCLRICSSLHHQNALEKFSTGFFLLACICALLSMSYGIFALWNTIDIEKHGKMAKFGNLTNEQEVMLMQMNWAWTIIYMLELWFIKLAFLAFYSIFYQRASPRKRILLYAAAVYIVISIIPPLEEYIRVCSPVSRNWDVKNACIAVYSKRAMMLASGFHISGDVFLLILPFFVLNFIELRNRARRIAFAFLFLIGSISLGASITKMILTLTENLVTDDPTRMPRSQSLANKAMLLYMVEKDSYFVAFALPSLRVLLRRTAIAKRFGRLFVNNVSDTSMQGRLKVGMDEFVIIRRGSEQSVGTMDMV